MKVTRHQDYTVSLRLRRHGDGTDTPSMDDILHALSVASLGFQSMAHKFPAEAREYLALADRYDRLHASAQAAVQRS